MNRNGLPLDSRETYTKTDWIIWTATMASDKATFERFVSPVWDFMETGMNYGIRGRFGFSLESIRSGISATGSKKAHDSDPGKGSG